jgi:NADH dehydrogenase/NADH:ubiquinone oxidoreductase subunit G
MTKTDDLKAAQAALTALQNDLPQFHSLLTDNEQDAQRLKTERAGLDEQVQAKNRVMSARELLEQHRADIQNARADVERLEVLAAREQTLADMTESALEAKRQRQVLESALEAANTALLKHVAKVDAAWAGMSQARESFLNAGGRLSPAFNVTFYPSSWTNEKIEAEGSAGAAILQELKSQGVDLDAVLMADDRRSSVFDLDHTRAIKQPQPFAGTVQQARKVFSLYKFNLNNELPGGVHG